MTMLKKLALLFLAIVLLSVTMPTPALAGADKAVSDDVIHDKVMQKLAGDPIVKGGGLEIDVKGGVVTLRGKVATDVQKDKASKVARKVKGVVDVNNELRVETP